MTKKIMLPELENPINSNFKKESFTGGLPCLAATAAVTIGIWIAS
jgi:hypothetical protein